MSLRRFLKFTVMLGLIGGGFYLAASNLMVPAKAHLSVFLIEDAWQKTLAGKEDTKPWPWMDSKPVAKLSIPSKNIEQIIMEGVSGQTLAFAPGWHDGTARPGENGISLIAAHKDTHFTYLKDLNKGDLLSLQTEKGYQIDYRIEELKILDEPSLQVQDHDKQSVLILSTCYPFGNWNSNGDMRFVVVAREIPSNHSMRLAGHLAEKPAGF